MRALFFIITVLWMQGLQAQNRINSYEYWYNGNYASRQVQSITPVGQYTLNTQLSTASLPQGLHILNLRFRDDSARYSATLSQFFYKATTTAGGTAAINAYQYWFNSDYAGAVSQPVSAAETFALNAPLATASLVSGLHILNLRFRDVNGQWSSTLSQFFYKAEAGGQAVNNLLNAWQYWFNSDFASAQLTAITPAASFQLSEPIPAAALPAGLHLLNLRFRDATNKWSSTVSQFFYKTMEATTPGANQVNAWQYWFDADFAQAHTMNIGPAGTVQLSEAIPTATLSNGLHVIHMRFRDNRQQWSSTLSQFAYIVPAIAIGQNRMRTMQYWFDDNYAAAANQTLPEQQVVQINEMLSATALPDGLHTLHLRFADTLGQWSSTLSQFFYKSAATGITTNVITGYRYWYNDEDATKMVIHNTEPQSILVLNRAFDMGCLTNGPNRLHLQFLDQKGQWSSALTDTISVTMPPSPIYRFTGNGNWSNAANWANNAKPALDLPGCKEIWIDHMEGGTCVLDVPQFLLKNAKLTVLPGKRFIIPENLDIK